MRVLILQHADSEHPGVLRDFMDAAGCVWDVAHLDRGDAIPALHPYDRMLVLGGPQDVWQHEEFPWLKDECAAIRRFVLELRRPLLGICLGHQLLAEALGGRVQSAAVAEVGVMNVEISQAGQADALFGQLENPLAVLQWHGAEVATVPQGAVVLARSPDCAIQAFRYGSNAYGMQFHVEVTRDTVGDWLQIPEYAAALQQALGPDGGARLDAAVRCHLPRFKRATRAVYDVWMGGL